jgi:hypothetical protein
MGHNFIQQLYTAPTLYANTAAFSNTAREIRVASSLHRPALAGPGVVLGGAAGAVHAGGGGRRRGA